MTERLAILGAGGFGRGVLDVVEAINDEWITTDLLRFEVVGVLDDGDVDTAKLSTYGVEHLGPISTLDTLPADVGFVIAIASPAVRREIADRFPDRRSPTLIHPTATIARNSRIGSGGVVCAGVRVASNVQAGRHVHLNFNATVGHDARLDECVTISPQVAISGYATVGAGVMIGANAAINPGVEVNRGATIGAGAVVVGDVPANATMVGVPARSRELTLTAVPE